MAGSSSAAMVEEPAPVSGKRVGVKSASNPYPTTATGLDWFDWAPQVAFYNRLRCMPGPYYSYDRSSDLHVILSFFFYQNRL